MTYSRTILRDLELTLFDSKAHGVKRDRAGSPECRSSTASLLASLAPGNSQGKGGTNMHEGPPSSRATVPASQPTSPNAVFDGCGHRLCRDLRMRKCRGPAKFGD